jgi:uncharacterized repeat protein (TIGR03803 family)
MFYGNAYQGGTNNAGAIYQITPGGRYSAIYLFNGTSGCCPLVTLLQDTTGTLYGDTYGGGTNGLGVFYSLGVSLRPFVAFLPGSGKVGTTVDFLGQGFIGTTAVSFNGTLANFTVKTGTFLTATVPTGATSGFVTVTTPKGTLKSNRKFIVRQ